MIPCCCWPTPSTESWRIGSGTAWPVWAASGRTPNPGREARACWTLSRRYGDAGRSTHISRAAKELSCSSSEIMDTGWLWHTRLKLSELKVELSCQLFYFVILKLVDRPSLIMDRDSKAWRMKEWSAGKQKSIISSIITLDWKKWTQIPILCCKKMNIHFLFKKLLDYWNYCTKCVLLSLLKKKKNSISYQLYTMQPTVKSNPISLVVGVYISITQSNQTLRLWTVYLFHQPRDGCRCVSARLKMAPMFKNNKKLRRFYGSEKNWAFITTVEKAQCYARPEVKKKKNEGSTYLQFTTTWMHSS